MFKKISFLLSLMLTLPILAHAWTISAKISTGQGSIKDNGLVVAAAPVPIPAPPGNISVANTEDYRDLIVTPASGYTTSSVIVDGKYAAPVGLNTYRVSYNNTSNHYITAAFIVQKVAVTCSQVANGTITIQQTAPTTSAPTTGSLTIAIGSRIKVTATPRSSYRVLKVTVGGTDYQPTVPLAGGVTFIVPDVLINTATTVTATYAMAATVNTALSVSPSSAFPGDTITFDATGTTSNDTGLRYAFMVTDPIGNIVHTRAASATITDTYVATAIGTFTVTMTATTANGGIGTRSATFSILDKVAYLNSQCIGCHINRNPQIIEDYNASPHKLTENSGTGCQGCHTSTPHSSALPTGNICNNCHADSQGNVPGHPFAIGTYSCTFCHDAHKASGGGCSSCHECPPATASHLKHYSGTEAQAGYGDTRITKDYNVSAGSYIMSCGNCHPMDNSKHGNSVIDVELYSTSAPAGSLKAKNPASASYLAGPEVFTDSRGYFYSKGTCSNVYCHSYNDWTTTQDIADSDPDWESKLVVTRKYKNITWGGSSLNCSGCHANPPRTAYPANDGGAGNSHSWIDPYGYDNLHNWNMYGKEPVSCSYCHNGTVQQLSTFTYDSMGVVTMGEIPISNYSRHVNGVNDVSFDQQKPFVYQTSYGAVSRSLSNATYNSGTKTCLNVACHLQETAVKWGTPYRWYYNECDRCHQYGH